MECRVHNNWHYLADILMAKDTEEDRSTTAVQVDGSMSYMCHISSPGCRAKRRPATSVGVHFCDNDGLLILDSFSAHQADSP